MTVYADPSIFDVVKPSLRVSPSNKAFDIEIKMLIDAALSDMERVGISREYLESKDPMVTHAVVCYCKSMFGYDNSGNAGKYGTNDSTFFNEMYRQRVCDMLNSSRNVAAIEQDMKRSEDA